MNIEFPFVTSLILFVVSVFFIWFFCTKLSGIVNFIDAEFNLGSAFGGTIILSVVTNLPEIAITINGSIRGNIDLAVGNILGGILVQSTLLVLFDFAGRKQPKPLSTLTSSKSSILQGLFLIIVLTFVIMGKQLKPTLIFARTTPPEIIIVLVWIVSVFAMKKFQSTDKDEAQTKKKVQSKLTKKSAVIWLIVISILVLVFGVLLETTSDTIATHFKINGVIFGATVLAFVTSLPEISGGLAFVKKKTYKPIISDIFGGNAFLPVLFLPATIITNKAILPSSNNTDMYLTAAAIIITGIYVIGMVISAPKKKFGLGYDSWLALLVYVISIAGMFFL
ncbi:MAG: sodium:calcium antiporter [Bacteroidia bacterium]